MLLIVIIISVIIFFILGIVIKNLLNKTESYEDTISAYQTDIAQRDDFIIKMNEVIKVSDQKIRDLDTNQMFSGDDDIGFFFESVKKVQSYLTAYKNAFEEFTK